MNGKPIKWSLVADISDLDRGFNRAEKILDSAADTSTRAGRDIEQSFGKVGDSSDEVASKGAQAAGALAGLGDLVGGPFGGAMAAGGIGLQAFADAGDLVNAAIEGVAAKLPFAKAAAEAETVAVRGMEGAQKAATSAMEAGSRTVSGLGSKLLTAASAAGPFALGALAIGGIGLAAYGIIKHVRQGGDAVDTYAERVAAQNEIAKRAKGLHDDLASTIDAETLAYGRDTRALIANDLIKSGAMKTLNAFGLTNKQAVQAVLGNGKAADAAGKAYAGMDAEISKGAARLEELKHQYEGAIATGADNAQALADQVTAQTKHNKSLATAKASLEGYRPELVKAREQVRANTLATRGYVGTLKGLPPKLKTEIRNTGIPTAKADVNKLIDRYDLTPTQIRTVFSAAGITGVKRSTDSLITSLQHLLNLGYSGQGLLNQSNSNGRRQGQAADRSDRVAITVNVPPTADKVAVGREVAAALDSYYRAGGRKRAI